jgi:hypothetical protein
MAFIESRREKISDRMNPAYAGAGRMDRIGEGP